MLNKDFSLFETTKEIELEIDTFLDKYQIRKDLTGREYLKAMIIYSLNDVEQFSTMENQNELYQLTAEYLGVSTWYNVRRLSDYACNDFFKRNGNSSIANAPKLLLTKAVYEILFKENLKNGCRKY